MQTLEVRGAAGISRILVGEPLERLQTHIPAGKPVIITDTTVARLYGNRFPDGRVITIGIGEKIKTLDTVRRIYEELVGLEVDRSDFLIGIGGGIVCDITGFVASTYLRGIRFGFVSTTLLAQVDASVGGKNGVNFGGFKNIVGVFSQPEFVICDMALLETLPRKERLCGFAEIIKHGLIADTAMVRFLEENADRALALESNVIEKLVFDSVAIKAGVVSRDERETGERRKLNFGHTIGHALEKLTGIAHGEAVGIGMAVAATCSVRNGLLRPKAAERIRDLIARYGLSTRPAAEPARIIDAMRKDKKREGEVIHFVFLDRIGHARVVPVGLEALSALITDSL